MQDMPGFTAQECLDLRAMDFLDSLLVPEDVTVAIEDFQIRMIPELLNLVIQSIRR